MNISKNVSLKDYSTMRLGGQASYFSTFSSIDELLELVNYSEQNNLPIIVVGQGSNIVWKDEGFEGLLLSNNISGREIFAQNSSEITLKIGAGEPWDNLVNWTVDNGWTGLEPLSLIPGLSGATPIQNVGAYGREISELIIELEAYDLTEKKLVKLMNNDCDFGYRTSRFKTYDKHRFIVTSLNLKLRIGLPKAPYYEALETYFKNSDIDLIDGHVLRKAVIDVRHAKLPDPKYIANNGSFFANPIIENDHFEGLKNYYPNIKSWPTDDGKHKLSAAWLIDEAGFKDFHDSETGMATWIHQPLVFINESAKSTADLLTFKSKITSKIKDQFGVDLVQEPELLP